MSFKAGFPRSVFERVGNSFMAERAKRGDGLCCTFCGPLCKSLHSRAMQRIAALIDRGGFKFRHQFFKSAHGALSYVLSNSAECTNSHPI